jgi:hypothetical protein
MIFMKLILVILILSIILISGCTQQPTGNSIVASSNGQETTPQQQTTSQPQVKTYGVGDTITKDDMSVKLLDANIDAGNGKLSVNAQIHAKKNAVKEYTNAASFMCGIYEPQSGKIFTAPQMITDFGDTEWDYMCVFYSADNEFDNFIKSLSNPIFIVYSRQIGEVRSLMDKDASIESVKSVPETYVFEYQPDTSPYR